MEDNLVFSYHWLSLSLELYFSVKSLESGECLWCWNSKQIWSPHVQPYRLLVELVQRHAHPSCCCQEKRRQWPSVQRKFPSRRQHHPAHSASTYTLFNKKKNLFCLSWQLIWQGRSNVHIKTEVERFPITFITVWFPYYYKYQLLISMKKKSTRIKNHNTTRRSIK